MWSRCVWMPSDHQEGLESSRNNTQTWTHRCAHHVAGAEVKAALLVHGVMQTRQGWNGGPLVVEGVVTETVVRAEAEERSGDKMTQMWWTAMFQ